MNDEIKKQTEDIINKLLSRRENKKKPVNYDLFKKNQKIENEKPIDKPEIKEEETKKNEQEEPIKIEEKPEDEIKENIENDHNLKKEENIIEPINNNKIINNLNLLKKNFNIEETSLPSINSFNSTESSTDSNTTLYTSNSDESSLDSLPKNKKKQKIMSDTSYDNTSTSSEEESDDNVSEVTDYESDNNSETDNQAILKDEESITSDDNNILTDFENDSNDEKISFKKQKTNKMKRIDEIFNSGDENSEDTNIIYKPVFKKQKIIKVPISIKDTTEELEKDEIKEPSSVHYPRPSSPYNPLQNLTDPVEKKSEVLPTPSSFSWNNYPIPEPNQQPKNDSIPYHQPVLHQNSFSNNSQKSQKQKKIPHRYNAL